QAAVGTQRRDTMLAGLLVDIGNHHTPVMLQQVGGNAFADALGTARHQRYFARPSHGALPDFLMVLPVTLRSNRLIGQPQVSCIMGSPEESGQTPGGVKQG